jgi:hypothetical protein
MHPKTKIAFVRAAYTRVARWVLLVLRVVPMVASLSWAEMCARRHDFSALVVGPVGLWIYRLCPFGTKRRFLRRCRNGRRCARGREPAASVSAEPRAGNLVAYAPNAQLLEGHLGPFEGSPSGTTPALDTHRRVRSTPPPRAEHPSKGPRAPSPRSIYPSKGEFSPTRRSIHPSRPRRKILRPCTQPLDRPLDTAAAHAR